MMKIFNFNKPDESLLSRILKSNRLVNDESNRLINWSLSLLGGSILILINSKYLSLTGGFVYAYGLFGYGWVLIFLSIYYGQNLTLYYTAGELFNKDIDEKELKEYVLSIDRNFHWQIKYFKFSLIPFGVWLFVLLIWLIYYKN